MLQASGRSYVCWRCAAGRLASGPVPPLLRAPSAPGPPFKVTRYTNTASRRGLATVRHTGSNYDTSGEATAADPKAKAKSSIRQRLRQWQEENKTTGEMMLPDFADEGNLGNNVTRPQNISMAQIDFGDTSPLFVGDELADLRSEDAMLDAGDLVELYSEGSRRPMLATCLGRNNGLEYFYTVSGKWFSSKAVRALFVVNKFATLDEINPVIAALPPPEIAIEALNALQDLGDNQSRVAGTVLLRKMLHFTQMAEAVYQENAATLDASSSFIGDPVKHRYLTLHEITDLLLSDTNKYGGKFSTHSLYAVHRALLQDEVFFRPLRHTGHKRSYLFEVSPLSEVRIIQRVEMFVRDYVEKRSNHEATQSTAESPVESFVNNAQRMIDESRKHREWSYSGLIGPSSKSVRVKPEWSDTDREILQFIELWASYRKFPAYSPLQTIGATLLRAIGRYEEAQRYLPSVGWTFLQEVGWIPPWEIPARYSLRFPGVDIKRGGSYIRPYMGTLDRHLKRDMLKHIRSPLQKSTAYCIDDVTAREIDDAVSLERTSNPDEYWIHVHVADPASSFGADTPVAKYAELIPEAIYLPGHLEAMLPESLIHARFSLAPDRPCLTFSALVNTDGVVLNERITANTLRNVLYMTYEDAALVTGEVRRDPYAESSQWSLGKAPKAARKVNRKMARPEELTEDQKSDLAILSKLNKAVQAKRLEKGATPFFQTRPMATVDFSSVKQKESDGFITAAGDPFIRVHYSSSFGTDLVENAMKLANEVAARWCHKRHIPIPYRTQPHALRNAALVQQYARDVVNPMLNSGIRPSQEVWEYMRSLIGIDEVSTTPGPHFTLGSDMYTKVTSPLRRFGDLIVHWQIEAALLEEAKSHEKKSDDLSFLPFSRERLDKMLPMLRLREKQARALTNADGAEQWILQALVRAWRFKEAQLPETFELTVLRPSWSRVVGCLNWFERTAILKYSALNGITVGEDLRVGDVLEVRITDVNVHAKQIDVEAIRILEKADDKKEEGDNTRTPLEGAVATDAPLETN